MNTETKNDESIEHFRAAIDQLEELSNVHHAVWRIEPGPLNSDHTIHFYAVKADEKGEPMIAAVGRGIGREFVQLVVQLHNNLPELIRFARIGLAAKTAEVTVASDEPASPWRRLRSLRPFASTAKRLHR